MERCVNVRFQLRIPGTDHQLDCRMACADGLEDCCCYRRITAVVEMALWGS